MNILLAYTSGLPDRTDPYISLPPVGLCSLHATLCGAGYNAVLANFSGWSDQDIIPQITEFHPDIIGISQWTHNRHASIRLAHLVRTAFPHCFIVMGGGHATFCYHALLQSEDSPLDCIVLGEGEETLLELAACRMTGSPWQSISGIAYKSTNRDITVTPHRRYMRDLDSLPFASSCLEHSIGIDVSLQSEFILTSRGCPSACTFCSSPDFWKRKVRFRSPASIVKEIGTIKERYGLIYFSIRDDTFTVDRTRTLAFCQLLIEHRLNILWNCQSRVNALDEELLVWMKRAGCECIQLGVESGSPGILKQLGKAITPQQVENAAAMIRKTGINLSVYLISDVPGETEHDIAQTIKLIQCIRPDDGYVSPLAYFPGTRMFNEAIAHHRIIASVFESNQKQAVYAVDKPGSGGARLLRALMRNTPTYGQQLFQKQKQQPLFCYVTNILAGEWYRQSGNYTAAEKEFREITTKEPDNPWGWYLLAELFSEKGKTASARSCYQRVCSLVPSHKQSLDALTSMNT